MTHTPGMATPGASERTSKPAQTHGKSDRCGGRSDRNRPHQSSGDGLSPLRGLAHHFRDDVLAYITAHQLVTSSELVVAFGCTSYEAANALRDLRELGIIERAPGVIGEPRDNRGRKPAAWRLALAWGARSWVPATAPPIMVRRNSAA